MAQGQGHHGGWEAEGVRSCVYMDVDISITASRIGMVRGKGLGVKEQRKVNQWNQYCKYREGLHGSSDWGGEGLMTL